MTILKSLSNKGDMKPFTVSKLTYKIDYSAQGKCPHCNKDIDISKSEEYSDNVPSLRQFEILHTEFQLGIDNYENFIYKTSSMYPSLTTIYKTWNEKLKEHLPIISKTKSDTTYILSGNCPYCNEKIKIQLLQQSLTNSPPKPDIYKKNDIATVFKCPKCNKAIHTYKGFFCNSNDYYYLVYGKDITYSKDNINNDKYTTINDK